MEGGGQKVVVDGAMYGRYLPSGHLIYMRAESIVAVPFDATRLEPTGGAVALSEKVATSTFAALAQIDVAPNGTLVYVPDLPESETEVVWLDSKGVGTPALPMRRRFLDAALARRESRRAHDRQTDDARPVGLRSPARAADTRHRRAYRQFPAALERGRESTDLRVGTTASRQHLPEGPGSGSLGTAVRGGAVRQLSVELDS